MAALLYYCISAVPEFIDPVFTKTSPKRSFSVIQNERFGLVFAKTGSIISGTEQVLRVAGRFLAGAAPLLFNFGTGKKKCKKCLIDWCDAVVLISSWYK